MKISWQLLHKLATNYYADNNKFAYYTLSKYNIGPIQLWKLRDALHESEGILPLTSLYQVFTIIFQVNNMILRCP